MSAPSPGPVTSDLVLRLLLPEDRVMQVPCRVGYDPAAPYEVSATFATTEGDVAWVLARDLLRAGLDAPVGEGDVVVWPSRGPDGPQVCLTLSSPSGRALLEAERGEVEEFLRRTDEAVPPGSESEFLDLDAVVSRLLDAGEAPYV
ncbi:MAG: SsgA family sporulation/cell division regulator [Candidatus Nanopelagicales bacterium]